MGSILNGLGGSAFAAAVLAGALAGAGGYTVHVSGATSYLSNDPAACVNCHIMREHFEGWQKASHHAFATCNDCHIPHALVAKYLSKAENGFWHSKGFTLQDFHEPIRIRPTNLRTLNANCASCHRTLVAEISGHARESDDGFDCVRCHQSVGHGPTR
jgi:cytochrome c nitrite reductase small subunit